MCSRKSLVLATGAATLGLVLVGASPQERPVFRSTAELVVVQAVVFSSDGGPVTNLTVDDFRITADGQERPISVFIRPDSGPLELALVVDTSGSMQRWPVKEAAAALLDRLDLGSCVLMLPFKDRLPVGLWAHPRDEHLRSTLAGLKLDGSTALYDAILAAFQLMRTRAATGSQAPAVAEAENLGFGDLLRFRSPALVPAFDIPKPEGDCAVWEGIYSSAGPARDIRRAIVVVSDGFDTDSQAAIEDVLLSAWGSRVPVFALALTQDWRDGSLQVRGAPPQTKHLRALEELAEYSGGVVIRATIDRRDRTGRWFWEGFERLGEALRSHYVLGYVPSKGEDSSAFVHRSGVEVSVRRPGFDVLAPSDLMLGRGLSESAALDLALRGFHELSIRRNEDALATFDAAAALGPELGLVHYGLGIALSAAGQLTESLTALSTAASLAPWIPDLNARIGELLVKTGDLDAAWEHVLLAYAEGSAVQGLINDLERLAPRDVDLTQLLPRNPRIRLQTGAFTTMQGALAVEPLLSGLGAAIQTSTHMSLASGPRSADFLLTVDVTAERVRGSRVSLSGWLVLESRDGRNLVERRFNFRDARSAEDWQPVVAATVREIEGILTKG